MRDIHGRQALLSAGPELTRAKALLVLIHGRGGSAEEMLSLYEELRVDGLAAVALQAAGRTWYPNSFIAPLASNQPYLDSALQRIESLVMELLGKGFHSKHIALLGFSQGACLSLEFVARRPRPYGTVMGITGGLIGPPGTSREYAGTLEGVKVFLGTSDPDPHVPFQRVQETQEVLSRMGAAVELRRYPGMSHTINEDELEACRQLLQDMVSDQQAERP